MWTGSEDKAFRLKLLRHFKRLGWSFCWRVFGLFSFFGLCFCSFQFFEPREHILSWLLVLKQKTQFTHKICKDPVRCADIHTYLHRYFQILRSKKMLRINSDLNW